MPKDPAGDAMHLALATYYSTEKLFAQLRLDEEMVTIAWPNGADLAPESVYFRAFKDIPALQKQFQEWGYRN